MVFNLKGLSRARQADRMPFLVFHGLEGTGKTSLACQFPMAGFLRVESGPPDEYDLPGWDIVDWNGPVEDGRAGLLTVIDRLHNEETDIETLVLDSTSKCETNIIHPDVCASLNIASIGDLDYGKAYIHAFDRWVTLLKKLDALRMEKAMTIILVCHTKIKTINEPDTPAYDRFELDVHESKSISVPGLIKRSVDGIFFIRQDTELLAADPNDKRSKRTLATGSNHWIYTKQHPARATKNRWFMPPKILYPHGHGFDAVARHIPSLCERYDLAPREEAPEKQAA